jgi:hypothetical protein
MNVIFDAGGWAVINNLSPEATVYLRGNVSGHGERPLAFSFDYGRGRVFFTSFHNTAQATSDMVNFIEYLVFRIHHREAELRLAELADFAGYVFDGFVFGILDQGEVSAPFYYTPQANDFMLLFDPEMGYFTIYLFDPHGNMFSTQDVGILTELDISLEDLHLAFEGFPIELITREMVVEGLGRQGFRVLNPIEGEWSFQVRSENPEPDLMFAVGLAQRPTAALTRAMFVQVLANLEIVDLSAFANVWPTFEDVLPPDWFFGSVEWAFSQDIVEGMDETTFAPNAPLTREQMATMLYRYANARGIELPITRIGVFHDHADISHWAVDAVMRLYSAGIIDGRADGSFDPLTTATTPEISEIFDNFLPFLYALWDEEARQAAIAAQEAAWQDRQEAAEALQDQDEGPLEDAANNGDGGGLSLLHYILIGGGIILLAGGIGLTVYLMQRKKSKPNEAEIAAPLTMPIVVPVDTTIAVPVDAPTAAPPVIPAVEPAVEDTIQPVGATVPGRPPAEPAAALPVEAATAAATTTTAKVFCTKCGKELTADSRFCTGCGHART